VALQAVKMQFLQEKKGVMANTYCQRIIRKQRYIKRGLILVLFCLVGVGFILAQTPKQQITRGRCSPVQLPRHRQG